MTGQPGRTKHWGLASRILISMVLSGSTFAVHASECDIDQIDERALLADMLRLHFALNGIDGAIPKLPPERQLDVSMWRTQAERTRKTMALGTMAVRLKHRMTKSSDAAAVQKEGESQLIGAGAILQEEIALTESLAAEKIGLDMDVRLRDTISIWKDLTADIAICNR